MDKIEEGKGEACVWAQEDEGSEYWWTSCSNGFCLTEGTPDDNKMKYCCYCGKIILEDKWVDERSENSDGTNT